MDIWKKSSRPSRPGPADWFEGTVRIDPILEAQAPARAHSAQVTFEPGARTAWHTHPLGQTIIIVSGVCWAQSWGGVRQEFHAGDVVRFAPGEKHWHGASSTSQMSHLAIHEALDGKTVDWMEQVPDDQYRA
jgi:quercetin dioxygenase-like cupin family protein